MIIVYHTKFLKLEEYSYDEFYNVLSQIYTVIKNDNSLNTMLYLDLYLDLYACLYQDYYSEMVLHGKEYSEEYYNKWYYICSLPFMNKGCSIPFILKNNDIFISSLYTLMAVKANEVNMKE